MAVGELVRERAAPDFTRWFECSSQPEECGAKSNSSAGAGEVWRSMLAQAYSLTHQRLALSQPRHFTPDELDALLEGRSLHRDPQLYSFLNDTFMHTQVSAS
jgi:hypothetical protein